MKSNSLLCILSSAILGCAQTVNLGRATPFAGLAPAGITNTGGTVLTGDLGTTGTSISGFPPGRVIGTTHINDTTSVNAQSDFAAAYTNARSLVPTVNKAGTTTLGGANLVAGIYKYDTGVGLAGTLTLNGNGNSNGVWVFQLATTLVTSSASNVIFTGGARASNVFWLVGSSATLGTYSHFQGNILAGASIAAKTGASVNGGLYAHAAITLDANSITVQGAPTAKMVRSAKFLLE